MMASLQESSGYFGRRAFRQVLLLCLLLYVFSAKGYREVEDTLYSFKTAQAIVRDGRLDIPRSEPYTLSGPGGKSYSKYGIGLPLYYVPWVVAADVLGTLARMPKIELMGFLISFASIPFAILTLILFAKLLDLFGVNGRYAWLLPLALGLGTLTWRYAVSDFSEAMQMCLLLLAVYGVVRSTPKAVITGGAGFGALILVKLMYAPFLLLFLAYLWTRPRDLGQRVRSTALFTFPSILAGGFVLWINLIRFGNALESGYGGEARQFFPGQLWWTVPNLLGSLDKGLFIYSPILLLGILGWKEFVSQYRAEAVFCGALLLANLIFTGAWHGWGGGWAWGPRLLVPAIPLWLLPAAFWLERRRSPAKYWVFGLLTFISIAAQIPGILVRDSEMDVIKQQKLTDQERRFAPSEYATACILLWHKLAGESEVYLLSEFHIPEDRRLDLTEYPTFIGLNVWTEQVARRMNLPALRWLPLLATFLWGYLAIKMAAPIKDGLSAMASA